jgi:hypothetical protein
MTNEALQKMMGFIIEQQAQMVVNEEKAEERIARLENAQIQTEGKMSELAEVQTRMSRMQEHMNEVVAMIADAQARSDERQVHIDERLDTLINAQIRTDERLDMFINVLERYISEGRNGKPE